MSTFSWQYPSARRFDFKLRFYVGTDSYPELWATGQSWGSPTGYDMADWPVPSFVTSPTVVYDPNIYGLATGAYTEVTSRITGITISEQVTGAFAPWTVTLEAYNFDPALFRRECVFVCTMQVGYDYLGTYTWTPWGIGFIGAIKSFEPSATHEFNGPFKFIVSGVGHFMDLKQLAPRNWGKRNIAQGRTATLSTTLIDPTPLYNKGEFVGTQVVLSASNLTDGVLYGPPAASAIPPTTANMQVTWPTKAFIRELYLWPPSGYGQEYQWISVSADVYKILTLGAGVFRGDVGDDQNRSCFFHTLTPYPGSPGGARNEIGIFCYSQTCVEELFDMSGASWVVEWGATYNHFISATQDYVIAVGGAQVSGGVSPTMHNPIDDTVIWSTNRSWFPTDPLDPKSECLDNYTPIRNCWTGATINPSSVVLGQSLARRKWDTPNSRWIINTDTNVATDWTASDTPLPAGGLKSDTPQWMTLDLGDINCPTKDNFDPTGAYPKSMTLETTYGLADSGSGIVNGQVFTYDSKTDSVLHVTAWSGNTFTVGAGNAVYQYDTVTHLAKRGWRIGSIKLWRKPGLSHIAQADLHASTLTGSLRTPGTANWTLDWGKLGDPKNGLALRPPASTVDSGLVQIDLPYDPNNPEKHRYTQLCLVVHAMRGNGRAATDPLRVQDGGLFLLNEIEVFPSEVIKTLGGTSTMTPATAAEVIKDILVSELGVPSAKVYIEPWASQPFSSQSTSKASVSSVISEIAQTYGIVVCEALDGTLHISLDPWWPSPVEGRPVLMQFDTGSLCSIRESHGEIHAVSQARITARDPEGKISFQGIYPGTPGVYGETAGEDGRVYIAVNQTHANRVAESVYKKAAYKLEGTFEFVGPVHWIRPYQIFTLYWPYTTVDGAPFAGRWYYWTVESVSHEINMGVPLGSEGGGAKNWVTTVQARAFSYVSFYSDEYTAR